jgi:hypothetical protein
MRNSSWQRILGLSNPLGRGTVRRRLCVGVGLLLLMGVFDHAAIRAGEVSKETILAAWREREEMTRTVKFQWRSQSRIKCFYVSPTVFAGDPDSPGGIATMESTQQLLIDGDKFDFRVEKPDGARHNSSISDRESFNGVKSQQLMMLANDPGTLFTTTEKYRFGVDNAAVVAILAAYRPLHAGMRQLDLEHSEIAPRRESFDGHECVILRSGGLMRRELWLDPKLKFLPRRFLSVLGGKPSIRIDMAYQPDAQLGWVLSSWRMEHTKKDGSFGTSGDSHVTSYALNEPIAESEFEIEAPAGAYIQELPARAPQVDGSGPMPVAALPLDDPDDWNSRILLIVNIVAACIVVVWLVRRRKLLFKKGNADEKTA